MNGKLTLEYDRVGDVLYVSKCTPYEEQDSDELGDDIIARFNPETGEVENLEILFFSKRFDQSELLELPILASMRLAG